MSFRTAVRAVARPRAVPAARAVVPRRFASSTPSSHKIGGSSDTIWMASSAIIFGGLAAFIIMPSETKDHVAHQQHPHEPKEPGAVQHTTQEKEDNVKNHKVEELAKKTQGDFRYEDVDEAKKQGRETTNPPKAVAAGDKKAPGEDENVGGNDDGSSADKSSSGDDDNEPSQKDIAASIRQGERTDAPPVAEAAETGSGSGSGAAGMTDSEGNEPSQESIKASIRQGERTDAPPVAEAAESE